MKTTILYVVWGYLSGSLLFARIIAQMLGKEDVVSESPDNNPGAANAFTYGGTLCGVLTLLGDLVKGAAPVAAYCAWNGYGSALALVLVAPVVGHAFPVFYGFRGGKGIAVSFGCLLGLLPMWQPVAILAAFFIFFSLVVRITPHYHRTWVTYLCATVCMALQPELGDVRLGFFLITVVVFSRLLASAEKRCPMEVKPLWKR